MADSNITPSNDINRLRAAVTDMDCLAQDGFSEILAIGKLALASMETPDGYRHPEIIALALRSIWGKAESIMNCINCEAESVGCKLQRSAHQTPLRSPSCRQQCKQGCGGVPWITPAVHQLLTS